MAPNLLRELTVAFGLAEARFLLKLLALPRRYVFDGQFWFRADAVDCMSSTKALLRLSVLRQMPLRAPNERPRLWMTAPDLIPLADIRDPNIVLLSWSESYGNFSLDLFLGVPNFVRKGRFGRRRLRRAKDASTPT